MSRPLLMILIKIKTEAQKTSSCKGEFYHLWLLQLVRVTSFYHLWLLQLVSNPPSRNWYHSGTTFWANHPLGNPPSSQMGLVLPVDLLIESHIAKELARHVA